MSETINELLQPKQNVVNHLLFIANIGSIITVFIGILCLLGWQFNISLLEKSFPFTAMMNPLSAVGFICLGISLSLFLHGERQSRGNNSLISSIQLFLSTIPLLIGLVMLLQFLDIMHSNFDQILFTDKLAGNRISPNSSVNFFFIGMALVFLQFHAKMYFTRFAQIFTLLAATISMFAVIGYIYDALSFYKVIYLAPMPLSSALTFSIFCLCILFARSNHGLTKILTRNTPSSTLALRLIVITLTLPAALGYLLLLSEQFHLIDMQTEIAYLIIGNIILLSSMIWINTRALQHIELKNLIIENELKKNNIKLAINAQDLAKKTLSLEEEKREIVDKLDVRNKLFEITGAEE